MGDQRLVVCVMGQNCERFISMCLEGIKEADSIVYCDGGSIDSSQEIALNQKAFLIHNPYNQEDKQMNGKQRNFYLNYLKENYPNDWALCLDSDEVVEDLGKIKEVIQFAKPGVYSVNMRHLIQDLAHEDSTVERHYVPHRLFKISEADKYPEVEHPVLQPKLGSYVGQINETTIWHLAYVPNLWEIKKRYDNHLKKSNMHTPEYLKNWYFQHLFGTYPKKQFDPVELPKVILDNFGIEKDELYFSNRGIEIKHAIMVKQWFDHLKPQSVLDLGCGRGPYLYFWDWVVPGKVQGYELSKFAVDNSFVPGKIIQRDVSEEWQLELYEGKVKGELKRLKPFDLITAIDILEHLNDEQLDKTLNNMAKNGNKFLFSIPFKNDPNLYRDKTHMQFKTKEEWKKLIESHGIEVTDAPTEWWFSGQMLIGRIK